ncbi:MAG: tRNA dihydrouridine synthase DusB [Thermoleophilia bacterium]
MREYSTMSPHMSHTDEPLNRALTRPWRLGDVRLENRLVQAPLAGISGRAFRLQARRFGVGVTVTEMVSSYGVHYRNQRTFEMLQLTAGEHPVAVQLFGNSPEVMAEAAVAAEEAGADIIDINMGCPVRKVVKTGAGVALMRDESLAAGIVAAVAAAVRIPVTVKMRAGFAQQVTAPSLAALVQEAGAAAVCIHPRTGAQGWRGRADHDLTARLAAGLRIPVIASGDISESADADLLLGKTGAAAVMVGRHALGNPWLFLDLLSGTPPCRRPLNQVLAEMELFYHDVTAEMGEARAGRYMRKFYGWYLGLFTPPGELRAALRQAQSFNEAARLAREGLG